MPSLSDISAGRITAEMQREKLERLLAESEQEIKSLRENLILKEVELDRIYFSRAWIFVQFFYRLRDFFIPRGSIRERALKSFYRLCKKSIRKFAALVRRQVVRKPCKAAAGDKYDLFVFSIIDWDFRFQRPQQIARKFAQAGHRVFYISQRFTNEKSATIRQIEDNLYELMLSGEPGINIYHQLPSPGTLAKMSESLHEFCLDSACSTGVLLVQLPFWTGLAEEMRKSFAWPIVYDCMDDHGGFSNNKESMLQMEHRLLEQSDLVVASSDLLEKKAAAISDNVAVVRNAVDYEHFASVTAIEKSVDDRKVIVGYYGAIADWFDSDMAADLAELKPDWEFHLVGNTFSADLSRLSNISNVKLLGEKPYAELPEILSGWDACIIPFRRMPLTEATNPVKVYEMLAAGMAVVSVDLPEVREMARAGLIGIANNAGEFAEQIGRMLGEKSAEIIYARREFAKKNTWADRYNTMRTAVAETFSKVSVIILTHNNLELNKYCLESILKKTDYPNYEVLIVENASTDGSREYLLDLSKKDDRVRVILNDVNESFARANNRAMDHCTGETVIYLNNDTIVTRGWITRLERHLKSDPSIGMIGPVSNAVGNEAKIEVPYTSPVEIDAFAEQYCRKHNEKTFEIHTLALFCTAAKRSLIEDIGRLDECYDVGMFEDDDLSMRVKQAGYRLVCAEDVFIHHFQQGTFKLLDPDVLKGIFEANRKRYEERWGLWKPHKQRRRLKRAV